MNDSQYVGPFRWRGSWNWKDITERILAGSMTGIVIGLTLWVMEKVVG